MYNQKTQVTQMHADLGNPVVSNCKEIAFTSRNKWEFAPARFENRKFLWPSGLPWYCNPRQPAIGAENTA